MNTTTPINALRTRRWKLINFLLAPIGRTVIKLGEWPDRARVDSSIRAIHAAGGTTYREVRTPAGEVQNLHFHIRRHHIRLCIEDYGDITLWGPRRIVTELAKTIATQTHDRR